MLVALVLVGCGGDDKSSSARTSSAAGTSAAAKGERTSPRETTTPAPEIAKRSRPSRRDREVEGELERHLRQEAVGVASGWRFADVNAVQVRSTSVAVQTRLGPGRREGATSLCLAARRFFEQGNQGQTAYDVLVTGRGDAALARC